jgi:hypothetical protein
LERLPGRKNQGEEGVQLFSQLSEDGRTGVLLPKNVVREVFPEFPDRALCDGLIGAEGEGGNFLTVREADPLPRETGDQNVDRGKTDVLGESAGPGSSHVDNWKRAFQRFSEQRDKKEARRRNSKLPGDQARCATWELVVEKRLQEQERQAELSHGDATKQWVPTFPFSGCSLASPLKTEGTVKKKAGKENVIGHRRSWEKGRKEPCVQEN